MGRFNVGDRVTCSILWRRRLCQSAMFDIHGQIKRSRRIGTVVASEAGSLFSDGVPRHMVRWLDGETERFFEPYLRGADE